MNRNFYSRSNRGVQALRAHTPRNICPYNSEVECRAYYYNACRESCGWHPVGHSKRVVKIRRGLKVNNGSEIFIRAVRSAEFKKEK